MYAVRLAANKIGHIIHVRLHSNMGLVLHPSARANQVACGS